MDLGELWNVLVVGLAIGLGVVLLETDPVAGICLVAYGVLVAVTSFSDRYEERLEEYGGEIAVLQLLLLGIAVVSLYVL
jgi:ribosomal protein L18E